MLAQSCAFTETPARNNINAHTHTRRNRTLQRLYIDDNGLGLEGYAAIRGALYGNTKIVDFPYPQTDVGRALK